MLVIILLIMVFWFSIALTEGWNWRMDRMHVHKEEGVEDNNKLITYHNYHIWRAVTTASVILLIVVAGFMDFSFKNVLTTIFANGLGWIIYERAMSFASHDDVGHKKDEFHIIGIHIKRPDVVYEFIAGFVFAFLTFVAWTF